MRGTVPLGVMKTTLTVLETITTISVLIVSSFLLVILLVGRRRFTVPFFRILTVLVAVIWTRSILSVLLKLITLWSGALIAYQGVITLTADMLFKKVIILLIFLLALNRFAVILYATLDKLLFARYRYIVLCFTCFAVSAAETYAVITTSKLRREFVPDIGFIDYIDSPTPYEIGCAISLAIAFASVCLHLVIIVYLLYHRRQSSVNTAKMFTLIFILLYRIPYSNESRITIISIYNILCFIPDILIPLFILIGSREIHAEISTRLSNVKKVKLPRGTVTQP
ncbi:unnamed protein product [Haemonchus placei]|uniref:Serpentine receptor class gamma n=1 Tax=Haemonchus placei TaxID=6290 RepID=A0A0N4W980_HAEPC|nr:unnamed protein product [Haemonchus placei]